MRGVTVRFSRDNLIILGILTVITITYFVVIYRAQSATMADVAARTAQTERRLKTDAMQASRVGPMLRQIKVMKQRYNKKEWDRRLPGRQELAGFLREIASNLSAARLSNRIIQPGNPFRGPLYNRLPITMKFEGDFLALAGFLKRVDEMTRLTRIEQLTIEPARRSQDHRTAGRSNEEPISLAIELGMNIYFTEQ